MRVSLRTGLIATFALALGARLLWILATNEHVVAFDAADYERIARSIARGEGYPLQLSAAGYVEHALRPPGFPYLLGGLYALFGDDATIGRVANAVIGAGAAPLTFAFCRRHGGELAGLVAGVAVALYPPWVVSSGALLSEPMYITLLAAAIVLFDRWRSEPEASRGWLLGAGAAAGLAVLARPAGLALLLGLIVVALFTRARPGRERALAAGAVAAAALVVCTPWLVRNWSALDRPVIATNAGFTFGGIYNSQSDQPGGSRGVWQAPPNVADFRDLYENPELNQAELDSEVMSRAARYAADHPGYTLAVSALNVQRLFGIRAPAAVQEAWAAELGASRSTARLLDLSAIALYLAAIAAVAAAAVLRRRANAPPREPSLLWLWLLGAFLAATTVPGLANPRYRLPLDWFVIVALSLAAGALAGATSAGTARRRS